MNGALWNLLVEALRAPLHNVIESSCNRGVSQRTHEILRLSQDTLVNIPVLLAVDVASLEDPLHPALQDYLREY